MDSTKRFRLIWAARVALLLTTLTLLAFLAVATDLHVSTATVAMAAAFQTFRLIRALERNGRDLARFVLAIQSQDFAQSFGDKGLNESFPELKAAFTGVLDRFRETRAGGEESHRYLDTVLQHIRTGLICYRPDGGVVLSNLAAEQLLDVRDLSHVQELEGLSDDLVPTLLGIGPGQRALVPVTVKGESLTLSVHASALTMRGQPLTLASLQNIQPELEDKESDAFGGLTQEMRHDIMLWLQPIISSSATVEDLLKQRAANRKATEEEAREDAEILQSVATITRKCDQLMAFVLKFRGISEGFEPAIERLPLQEALDDVEIDYAESLAKRGIAFSVGVEPESLAVMADPEMIGRVLLNLVSNAVHAVEGRRDARIEVRARLSETGGAMIEVIDNGPGIPKDLLEKVFYPFYTTRKGGTGVGLTVARRIMRAHEGSLTVRSEVEVQTVFTMRF